METSHLIKLKPSQILKQVLRAPKNFADADATPCSKNQLSTCSSQSRSGKAVPLPKCLRWRKWRVPQDVYACGMLHFHLPNPNVQSGSGTISGGRMMSIFPVWKDPRVYSIACFISVHGTSQLNPNQNRLHQAWMGVMFRSLGDDQTYRILRTARYTTHGNHGISNGKIKVPSLWISRFMHAACMLIEHNKYNTNIQAHQPKTTQP